MRRADELEDTVWWSASGTLGEPERLRADLERVVELERRGKPGDPERGAKA